MAWFLVKHTDNFTFTFTHLHQVLRPRMRGDVPPLPITSSWRGA